MLQGLWSAEKRLGSEYEEIDVWKAGIFNFPRYTNITPLPPHPEANETCLTFSYFHTDVSAYTRTEDCGWMYNKN